MPATGGLLEGDDGRLTIGRVVERLPRSSLEFEQPVTLAPARRPQTVPM